MICAYLYISLQKATCNPMNICKLQLYYIIQCATQNILGHTIYILHSFIIQKYNNFINLNIILMPTKYYNNSDISNILTFNELYSV